jgi:hypothetical protein
MEMDGERIITTPPTVHQHIAQTHPQIEPARAVRAAPVVPVAPASAIYPFVTERDGHLDFEQFCYKPFVIRNEYLPVLNNNPIDEAAVRAIFARVPMWEEPTPSTDRTFLRNIRPDRTSPVVLERGAYIASGGYGAAFEATFTDRNGVRFEGCVMKVAICNNARLKRQAILEMCVQAVVSHTCNSDPYIIERQRNGRMTKTPIMLAAFVVIAPSFVQRGNEVYDTTPLHRVPYFVYVMEKVGTTTWHHFLSTNRSSIHAVSTAIAFSMYQVASLFDRLGQLIEFNHRDCHARNVTIRYNEGETTRQYCSSIPFFQTCLIDFGFSRLTFRGRTFLAGSNIFFPENAVQNYKNGLDIVLFAWSIRHALGCESNIERSCNAILPSLDKVLQTVMSATGINFNTFIHASMSQALYKALSFAGEDENLRRIVCDYSDDMGNFVARYTMHNAEPGRSNPRLFSNKFVKQSMAIVLRICTWWCHPITRGITEIDRQSRIEPLEHELQAIIDREQTLEANEDEVSSHATV